MLPVSLKVKNPQAELDGALSEFQLNTIGRSHVRMMKRSWRCSATKQPFDGIEDGKHCIDCRPLRNRSFARMEQLVSQRWQLTHALSLAVPARIAPCSVVLIKQIATSSLLHQLIQLGESRMAFHASRFGICQVVSKGDLPGSVRHDNGPDGIAFGKVDGIESEAHVRRNLLVGRQLARGFIPRALSYLNRRVGAERDTANKSAVIGRLKLTCPHQSIVLDFLSRGPHPCAFFAQGWDSTEASR